MTVTGSLTIPMDGLFIILPDAFSILIHLSQIILGGGIVLLSSFKVPFDRFRIILWNAFTILIHLS